jgi:hypothetical protein
VLLFLLNEQKKGEEKTVADLDHRSSAPSSSCTAVQHYLRTIVHLVVKCHVLYVNQIENNVDPKSVYLDNQHGL